ncbi:MAG: endonuclease III [Propionibacteriaceae bacterium]|nr:endonuclease III [Propionibacteriaceae bacterium]
MRISSARSAEMAQPVVEEGGWGQTPRRLRQSLSSRRAEAVEVLDILAATYPDAKCELDFASIFQLLISTILSAQSTDRRVNWVTRELYARYPDAKTLGQADVAEVERIIHSVGFYHVKALAIIEVSNQVCERFGSQVPSTLEELITLPSVGRKTANVVLSEGYGIPGITTDTHILRLSRRLGWTRSKDPVKVEAEVGKLIAQERWIEACHVLIWHGRRRCHARRPACGACPVAHLCPSFGEGETDPVRAQLLLREPRG